MKLERHSAIRQLVTTRVVSNQDELRRLLVKRGHEVTQATLSRDLHALRLFKGPGGYQIPSTAADHDADRPLGKGGARDARRGEQRGAARAESGERAPRYDVHA